MSKIVVYVSGSSGVGKNTIINHVTEKMDNVKFLVSYTTRTKREFEEVDKQYHFVGKDEFKKLIADNKIIEFDEFNGNYYGHCKDSIDEGFKTHDTVIKDLTVGGVKQSLDKLANKYRIVTIFLTESKNVLKERLIGRGEKEYVNRLKQYKKEQKQMFNYNYVVKNSTKEMTIDIISHIIELEQKNKEVLTNVSCDKVKLKHIIKIEDKLLRNKKVKPIQLGYKDGQFYIIKGINTYLASKKCGVPVCNMIKNEEFEVLIEPKEQKEWIKIVKSYKKDGK